jgi:hypothetical protein
VLGFTNHDKDLVIDTVTYQAASGLSGTATRQTFGLKPDSQDVFGFFDSAAITDEDLAAGLYLNARVWHFMVDWTDPSAGKHKLDAGVIGPVTRTRNGYTATVYNLESILKTVIGRKYQRFCSHTLGDANCGIELDPGDWQATEDVVALDVRAPTTYDGNRYVCTTAGTTGATEPTWDTTIGNTTNDGTAVWTAYEAYIKEGTITGVTSNQVFADSSRTESDDEFTFGWITWVTGNNAGLTMGIKRSLNTGGAFTLLFPMPFDVQVGDTYRATRGCNKLLKLPGDTWGTAYTGDCRAKFNTEDGGNAVNFGGFPEIPGDDSILAGGS